MFTEEQELIIDTYVNEEFFDVNKLKKYLEMHDIVGHEIFPYIDKKTCFRTNRKECFCRWLDDEEGYTPLSRDLFIKRLPFYCYVWNGDLDLHCGDLGELLYATHEDVRDGRKTLEDVYKAVEYLFYDKRMELYDIFNYMIEQTGLVTQEYFWDWIDYIKLTEQLGWDDLMPERFITAYNLALEAAGKDPIIYHPYEMMHGEMYLRHGTEMYFEGTFPCDEYGDPIMRWIGIKMENVTSGIASDCEKSQNGKLFFNIAPNSVISIQDEMADGSTYWKQVYAGPQAMEFDYTILKEMREFWGMTQKEVADAVEASVRTYQKWEAGVTKPDCFYLIRLMNWLHIDDIQRVTIIKTSQ